jgi:hypothetical protein
MKETVFVFLKLFIFEYKIEYGASDYFLRPVLLLSFLANSGFQVRFLILLLGRRLGEKTNSIK